MHQTFAARAFGAIFACTLASCSPPSPEQDRGGPPIGEERERILVGIRESYPDMPQDIAGMLADVRRELSVDTRCELAEWLSAPSSGAPLVSMIAAGRLTSACALGVDDLDAASVSARLGARDFAVEVADGVVTLLARSQDDSVDVCCSLQLQLSQVGDSDFWVVRRRMAGLDRAMLTLFVVKDEAATGAEIVTFRGQNAPVDPPQVAVLSGRLFEDELYSASLGEVRHLKVYLPPGWTRDRSWPAVFLTDGASADYASMVEAMIADGAMQPIILVSALAGAGGVAGQAPTAYGPDLRSAEYIRDHPGAGSRFDDHMTFFAVELVEYAVREYSVSGDRTHRGVAGFSSGGVFALWAGLLNPDVFAFAGVMSPGVAPISAGDLGPRPRAAFRLSGGLYEPSFLEVAKVTKAVLANGGYDVSALYLAAGHDQNQWRVVMYRFLAEAFPVELAVTPR